MIFCAETAIASVHKWQSEGKKMINFYLKAESVDFYFNCGFGFELREHSNRLPTATRV